MSSELKNKLTGEEIDLIASTLGEGVSDEVKKLREIMANPDSDVVEEEFNKEYIAHVEGDGKGFYPYNVVRKHVEPKIMDTYVDPATGVLNIIGAPTESDTLDVAASDLIDEEIMNTDLRKETLEGIKDFGLSDEDSMKMMSIITRYKNKEKFSVFGEMPEPVKNMVRTMCPSKDPNLLRVAAKDLVEHFIRGLYTDQKVVDLQEAIKKELDIPEMHELYNEKLRQSMQVDLLKKADEIEAAFPDKAKLLRGISSAYTDAFSMTSLYNIVSCDVAVRNKLKKDNTRYKRFCNDFNFKYKKESKFKIKDVRMIEKVLSRRLPNVSKDDIISFVIAFCKVTKNGSSENVVEHTFMYYTIQNILLLDHINEESDFSKDLINNIMKVIYEIQQAKQYVSFKGNKVEYFDVTISNQEPTQEI